MRKYGYLGLFALLGVGIALAMRTEGIGDFGPISESQWQGAGG